MQFAQRQRHFESKRGPLLAAVPLGLLIGFVGPFGSYPAFPTPVRYAFWLGLTLVGVMLAIAVDATVAPASSRLRRLRIPAITLISAIPLTFVVAWTISLVQTGRTYSPIQLFDLFWGVAAVQLFIVVVMTIAAMEFGQQRAPAATETDAEEQAVVGGSAQVAPAFPDAFLARLPPIARQEILALETEDHYLRVHAAGSSALVLMRMADAADLIDARLGMQVHRRWWVSAEAVEELRNNGQKLTIHLANGLEIPVGRTFASDVRARFYGLRKAAQRALIPVTLRTGDR